jgi:hypothetical protein
VYYECYGGNDNGGAERSKNFDLGDAFKGATTDAITKIGSYLGIAIDVFKGQHNGNGNGSNAATPKPADQAAPTKWLNVLDKDNNLTKEWTNIVAAIGSGKITSVADVRKYYAVNKDVAERIENLLKEKEV